MLDYLRTKEQIRALTKQREDEIERRCADGGETQLSVARSMGISKGTIATHYHRILRRRKRFEASDFDLSTEECGRFRNGISVRLALAIRRNGWEKRHAYMDITKAEFLRTPNVGRKTFLELEAFKKLSKRLRCLLLAIDMDGNPEKKNA